MSTLREQFSAVRKAQVETQLDFVRQFSNKVVESTGKVVALNLSTGRSSFEKSTNVLRQLLTAQNPGELVSLSTQQAGFDTLLSYSSELFNIASRAQADLLKSATPALVPGLKALPSAKVEVEVQAEAPAPAVEVTETIEAAPQPEPETVQQAVAPEVAVAVAEPAPQVEAAPAIEIAEEVPAPEAFQETVLAKAISDIVEQAEAPVLAASPLVTGEAPELKITGMEPVDAVAPPVQTTGNPKANDNGSTKSRRKK